MATRGRVDKQFLVATIILVVAGFFIFSSAALGLLARQGANYSSVAFSQTVLGLCLGAVAMYVSSRINSSFWHKSALFVFIAAALLNLALWIPGAALEHGGARRWLSVGGLSFQPAELLKFGFILCFASWLAHVKAKVKTFKYGFLPLLILLSIAAGLLLIQPDTDNFLIIVITGTAMYLATGGRWRDVAIVALIGLIGITVLALSRPYVMRRITTFINPSVDAQGASWQIQQSLIAIGSGELFGNGFGQSIQKFRFLPEPVGDSIFAVAAEEFGFVGAVSLIALFIFFAMRGLKIASRTPDLFSGLVVVGIVIMIASQALVNIGGMLGVLPLSGITLPFVSHGGTSLFITMLEAGIVLSISRQMSHKKS